MEKTRKKKKKIINKKGNFESCKKLKTDVPVPIHGKNYG